MKGGNALFPNNFGENLLYTVYILRIFLFNKTLTIIYSHYPGHLVSAGTHRYICELCIVIFDQVKYLNLFQFMTIGISKLHNLTVHSFNQQVNVFGLFLQVSYILIILRLQLLQTQNIKQSSQNRSNLKQLPVVKIVIAGYTVLPRSQTTVHTVWYTSEMHTHCLVLSDKFVLFSQHCIARCFLLCQHLQQTPSTDRHCIISTQTTLP